MVKNPTAMIHLYRGELGRMTAYRIRLDTTSNWALGSTVAIVTFVLGHPEVHHAVLVLPALLTGVFALIEARRLQDLELIRSRVRILEQGFFAPELGADEHDDWQVRLAESLREPRMPLSIWRAVAVRLQRNYAWLFLTLYAAWWLELWTASPGPVIEAAMIGPIPGVVSIVVASVGLLVIMGLAATARPVLPG